MPPVSKTTPKVTLQRPTGKTATINRESVLTRIRQVKEVEGLKLCVYGRGKTGKTRLSCTFPTPLLLIGTEDGTKSVLGVPGVDFVKLQTSGELTELVNGPLAEGKYKTVVLDTAGGYQDLILKEELGIDKVPVQKTWGLADRAVWGQVGIKFKERLRELIDLADNQKLNVVIIAHERNFSDEGADGELLNPAIGAALTPTCAGFINTACDYVCQTFIKEEEVTSEQTINGKKMTVKQKNGKAQYCLRIGPHPVYMTGFRLPPGRELPDMILNPTYDRILKVIKGERL